MPHTYIIAGDCIRLQLHFFYLSINK